MFDNMNELTQFSPYAGELILEEVPADTSKIQEAENSSDAGAGSIRSMYVYAPKSGCPAPKQCQILMVLRNGRDKESAVSIMKELELDRLAEEEHFLLIFPDPLETGWNYKLEDDKENDIDFLIRCFAALRKSKNGVTGFNGMTFYAAVTPEAGALLADFAALKPLNVPAIITAKLPDDYELPEGKLNVPVAAFTSDPALAEYLIAADSTEEEGEEIFDDTVMFTGKDCPEVRLLISGSDVIDAECMRNTWNSLFSVTRRWQNDTYGTYQARTDFTGRGFTAHVKDTSLGVNDNRPQTWYEYIPKDLRGSTEKVPLVIYLHGGGCVPLYGAEQSCWHDIADREGFIVVYPEASFAARWNVWNDPTIPSDDDFIMALIGHMKKVHPIDESRIYVSGFSMGGMMSHAMACLHPSVFAAAAPCNAYNDGYFTTLTSMMNRMKAMGGGFNMDIMRDSSFDEGYPASNTRIAADLIKQNKDYRMPVFQISGLCDMTWPIKDENDGRRYDAIKYWMDYDHIVSPAFKTLENMSTGTSPGEDLTSPNEHSISYESGLYGDENCYEGDDKRFLHQSWKDENGVSMLELLLAKRMPHALDLRAPKYAWEFMKKFSRGSDGEVIVNGNA